MRRFLKDERAQDLVEFSLILAFATFSVIGVAGGFQSSLVGMTSSMKSSLAAAGAATQWAQTDHYGNSVR